MHKIEYASKPIYFLSDYSRHEFWKMFCVCSDREYSFMSARYKTNA